jgi:2-phosphosulfolactate phosphatase
MKTLETLFTPADFSLLPQRDLRGTRCVVFDVLRATSSLVTALGNGAQGVIPVSEISEALQLAAQRPGALLAGERDGLKIGIDLTGSVAFDLGNSPREFVRQAVQGRTIIMTTTNGTRALKACAAAREVLAGSFLNLQATADWAQSQGDLHLLLVCSGTFEEAAYEDVLAAGALCDLVCNHYDHVADSAFMARRLFELERADLNRALAQARNGRRLLSRPELRDDVRFCAQLNTQNLVARLNPDGQLQAVP